MKNEETVANLTQKFQEELGVIIDDYASQLQDSGTDFSGDEKSWGSGHILLLAIMRDWAEGNAMSVLEAMGIEGGRLADFDPDDMESGNE